MQNLKVFCFSVLNTSCQFNYFLNLKCIKINPLLHFDLIDKIYVKVSVKIQTNRIVISNEKVKSLPNCH